MPITRYSQYTGKWWDSLSLEDLFGELGDHLLQSGFQNRFMDEYLDGAERGRDLQELYRAILEALASGGQIRYEDIEDWLEGEESEGNKQLDQVLKALLERMLEEGYITLPGQETAETTGDPAGLRGAVGRERIRQVRADQQGNRLPRLSHAAGSLGLARPKQRRAPRHARAVHGGRGVRGARSPTSSATP